MYLQRQPYARNSLSGLAHAPETSLSSLSHERGLQSGRYFGGQIDNEGKFKTYPRTLADTILIHFLQLPHRTGSPSHDFTRDEVVVLTRATLVGVSTSSVGVVIEALIQLLEELSRPYKGILAHPIHILHSELYIIELVAECCSTHWASVNAHPGALGEDGQDSESEGSASQNGSKRGRTEPTHDRGRRASRNKLLERDVPPDPLDDDLVRRLIDVLKLFSRPLSDSYVLPAANILDDVFKGVVTRDITSSPDITAAASGTLNDNEVSKLLQENSDTIDSYIRSIVEYVSFSNWSRILEYVKVALRTSHPVAGSTGQNNTLTDDDRNALITLRFISSLWVDSRKLSVVIQELCGSFLHLRKAYQTTVAIVLPLLINRWLERNPEEFIDLHTMHKRLDGGAETLFDMSNTMFDGARRKALLFPFQTCLLFLLPDVFEVASNMRDVKSSSMSKKVSFLEMLRKTLRNRNETAIYCLTSVLRVARHFTLDSDAALLSYALDVQEEVREAVFRRNTVGVDASVIDSSLMTAAFVSLAHLNFESCVDNLAQICLAPNSPQDFKIAVISACSHFARQSNAEDYQPLFSKVAEFIRSQLRVCDSSSWPHRRNDANESRGRPRNRETPIPMSTLQRL
jgi:neurofibromin 1